MGKPSDLVQGTLDLLILKTLSTEARHGWSIAKRIQQISGEVLQVQQGSLYPALHRLEQQAWIKAKWAESETGRQAKFYTLTAAGRKATRVRDRQLEPPLSRPSTSSCRRPDPCSACFCNFAHSSDAKLRDRTTGRRVAVPP